MSSPVPDEWRYDPPESLVVGDGSYAAALASILGTVAIPFDQLHAGPDSNADGGYPRVLENLNQVFLVVADEMPAADALRCHQSVWNWVEKLTFARDQHELAFLFILPENASNEFDQALAVGLSVPAIYPATTGHAVWRRSGTLVELLNLVAKIIPMDLLPLKARRAADHKRVALIRLRVAVTRDNPTAIRSAALAVLDAFQAAEYHLDLFCRAPSHQNGNLLRGWLNASVTGPVTQDWCATGRNQVTEWLKEDLL